MFIQVDQNGNLLNHHNVSLGDINIEIPETYLITFVGQDWTYKYKYVDVERLISAEIPERIESQLVSEEVLEQREQQLVSAEIPEHTEQILVSEEILEVLDENNNVITPYQAAVYEDVIIPMVPAVYEEVITIPYQAAVYEDVVIPMVPAVYETKKELVEMEQSEIEDQPHHEANLSRVARQLRDKLLAESDFVVTTDSAASVECKAAFVIYRQNLRDVSEQELFPTVNWPIKPEYIKA